MGRNKSFLEIDGERLIDRTVRILRDIFTEIIIATNSPLEYLDLDAQIVTDIFKGKGSLGGIYTGLFYASSEKSFVTACDMPFLNQSFIEYMVKSAAEKHDIVVPKTPKGPQPLHAIYAKTCLPNIKNLMDQDKLKITGFYKGLDVLFIQPETLQSFDPEERMFFNINSEEDLKQVIA
ncbi:MAG: molybdenum cofactor guanylyltransferase [Deltaproteobacteria bacterium]|nr:molybdenum cofactor guanylyltransferase [Deltaproteobacteria bacterium]